MTHNYSFFLVVGILAMLSIGLALIACATVAPNYPDEQVIVPATREHGVLVLSHREGDDWTKWTAQE